MHAKHIVKIIALILAFLVGMMFILTLVYYNDLKGDISESVKRYSYFGVSVISFLVEAIPQVFGGDVPLVAGGLIGLNVFWVWLVVCISAFVASMFSYSMGYMFGKRTALFFIDEITYIKYLDLVKRKGKFALTITALTPIPYVPALAGVFKMHPYDFLLYGVAMRLIRFGVVAYVLYLIVG